MRLRCNELKPVLLMGQWVIVGVRIQLRLSFWVIKEFHEVTTIISAFMEFGDVKKTFKESWDVVNGYGFTFFQANWA